MSFFARVNLHAWLELSATDAVIEFASDTLQVLEALSRNGALFFGELLQRTGLLPSRVEQALGELAAQGAVTSDSFEGLRALLVPAEKRLPFARLARKRRHKSVTSVEFAGRWSLLRQTTGRERVPDTAAVEIFARALLRRYGIVFRRLLEREAFRVSWFDLCRVYRHLEARGEIRGGHFISGVSGEQFALPEAIGLLRSVRKAAPKGELITLNGADPLNLAGILTPGPRITAIAANRLLLRDGLPVAGLEGGQIVPLNTAAVAALDGVVERSLRLGSMSPALRPYYA